MSGAERSVNHFLGTLDKKDNCFSFLNFQIPILKKHRPVPQTTYHEPREQIEMSAIQEMNRRQAEVGATSA